MPKKKIVRIQVDLGDYARLAEYAKEKNRTPTSLIEKWLLDAMIAKGLSKSDKVERADNAKFESLY